MKLLPIVALLASAVMWGVALPAFKAAVNVPAFSFALIRFVVAFLAIVPFYLFSKSHQNLKYQDIPKIIAAGILGVTLNIGLLFVGLKVTSATDAAIITNLTPILAIFAAAFFLREPLTKHHLIGSIIAFVGAIIILGEPLLKTGLASSTNAYGNFLILLSAISWVGFNIISKNLFHTYTTVTIVTFLFLVGVVTFTPFAAWEYLTHPSWIYSLTSLDIAAVTYYAIFGSIFAYFFYEYGLSKVDTGTAAATQHLIPVVSIAIAVLFLGEKLTMPFVIGAVLIFLGVIYSTHLPLLLKSRKPVTQSGLALQDVSSFTN